MKNRIKFPKVIVITIIVFILTVGIFLSQSSAEDNKIIEITKKEATVENRTITTTLTAAGEVKSALEEKLTLNTNYNYLNMCAEKNEMIKKGENLLKYTNGKYLIAPYDCVIIATNLPNQDEICTTSHYIEINSIQSLSMKLSVSEADINKIEIGDIVDIKITATDEKISGYITSISEVGTYNSNGSYFEAIVTFENNGNLKIGMSATCEIIIEKVENVIAVPIEAVQTSDSGKYVILVNSDGTTTQTEVETGISNDAYIEIKSGLSDGDIIQMTENDSSTSSNTSGGNFKMNMENFQGGMPAQGFEGTKPSAGSNISNMP